MLLIRNALVYSGRLEPPRKTDLAVENDRIAAVGADLPEERIERVIDAEGLLLAPGFIDPHASTGFGFFFPQAADHKLYQGITTEIFGNCGTSTAPVGEGLVATMERLAEEIGFPFEWSSLGEYFSAVEKRLQFNIGSLIGHSTLRQGYVADWNNPRPDEQKAMEAALAKSMEEGALGLSTGLIYAPGCFAPTGEIVGLARVAKRYGGVYASHIRDERDRVEEAVEEALTIGRQADIPVLVSHLKAAERKNWGKIPRLLERIERYNDSGEGRAAIDVYPYTAVSTKLRAFIPKHFLENGVEALPQRLKAPDAIRQIEDWIEQKGYDLSQMLVISHEFERYYGKDIRQIAAEQACSLAEAMAAILIDSTETWIVYHCIQEADMDAAIRWPRAMICTDSWSYPINAPNAIGQPHPRSYGAFTTFLERYVLEKKWLSWEEAFHKIAYLPARFFNLEGRGVIEPGAFADLVALDPAAVKANATYLDPKRLSGGLVHLWVNGRQMIENGRLLSGEPGRVLTHTYERQS